MMCIGCESDPGMMILCVRDILDWVKTHPNVTYNIKISYLEVYNEEINDLLGRFMLQLRAYTYRYSYTHSHTNTSFPYIYTFHTHAHTYTVHLYNHLY
ncbi:hypothetical protein EON65_44675 [archaeon]|nr:MAG: hypothetical protein EON65_44675 [archaeon]